MLLCAIHNAMHTCARLDNGRDTLDQTHMSFPMVLNVKVSCNWSKFMQQGCKKLLRGCDQRTEVATPNAIIPAPCSGKAEETGFSFTHRKPTDNTEHRHALS